ncbi:MAG TPA: helix-turn-helix transcriptional regulator [Trebonia sp.]|nr:helix-turn-helix transcriptional regulator [Trebonia sp.]
MSLAGAGAGDGGDAEAAAWMRAEMGRELAHRRRAAGLSQGRFAELTGSYSQSAVAHAERGRDDVGAGFWRAADRLLGTDGLFAGLHDEVRECMEPGRRAAVPGGDADPVVRCGAALKSAAPDRALAGYRRLGWPVSAACDGTLELLTGKTADVLEVGRPAGMVAAGAWLESGGAEGTVRPLPRLPAPEGALAVIEAGERWFFLVRTGFPFPWQPAGGRRPAADRGEAEIRWHSGGGRVPLPPSKAGRATARWAYLPEARLRPAPPLALLDLLGWAVAVTRDPGRLLLPGGAAVVAAVPRP